MKCFISAITVITILFCSSCGSLSRGAGDDLSGENKAALITDGSAGRQDDSLTSSPYKEPHGQAENHTNALPEQGRTLHNPLSRHELSAAVFEQVPWNFTPVHQGSGELMIFHDLDKNGYEDVLLLAVEGDSETDASVKNLSESSRLFEGGGRFYNYFLLIFYQYEGRTILRYTVPVAEHLVFSGMSFFEIREGSDFPYALQFSFRTRAGIERELVILSGFGITGFTLKENLSEFSHVEDIDDDGYIDIVIHEQGFEEGTGFETFLTWYKWDSKKFTENGSTNIVRNLRDFLNKSANLMESGRNLDFLRYAVDSEVLDKFKENGLSDYEIMKKIFYNTEESPYYDSFFEDGSVFSVTFPEIMETPFSYDNRNVFMHRVSVRFGRAGGESIICTAELRMKKNPFENGQFCFSTDLTGDKFE